MSDRLRRAVSSRVDSTGDWRVHGADFGKVATKKLTIFGYKLHLLITRNGLILDFALAPASAADLTVGCELLAEHTDLDFVADKGYISAAKAAALLQFNRVHLLTLPRSNQQQRPPPLTQLHNTARQMVETLHQSSTQKAGFPANQRTGPPSL